MPLDVCPNCGAERTDGLCSRCLLKLAMTGDPFGRDRPTDVDPEATQAKNAEPRSPKSDRRGEGTAAPTDETVDHDPTPGPNDQSPTTDGRARPSARGTTVRYFGDYEIQNELGRGGMGVVYKALQISLNRPVALKVIKAGVLADAAEVQRFQNEAEAVALLDHAGIVPVYEVGEHEGQRYFSMKLVEGGNLAEGLPMFKADPRAAATLIAETAEAVHHAHMRGILHRDLKPANILVDAQGHPHVTDFGLAKRVEGDIEMTQSGAILGTPAYMSPEQAHGRRGSISTATDVYGLGAILYALLAGKAPFGGDGLIETLDAVRTRPPESPKNFNADVPLDLETICLKCLEKDPRRRYASAHELAADLTNWLDCRPITARRVGAAERAWLWCKRKPAIAALSAATMVAVIAGTATTIAVQARANTSLRKSNIALDQQRARAEDREAQAIEAVKRFGDVIANEPELKKSPALGGLRKRLLKEPLTFTRTLRDRLQADSDTRPESLARLAGANFYLGRLTAEIGDKQDALTAYRESLAIQRKLVEANPDNGIYSNALANAYTNFAILLRDTGKPDEALKVQQVALAIRQRLADANPTVAALQNDLALGYSNTGNALWDNGKLAEARKAQEAALAIQRKLADANPDDADVQAALANYHNNTGNLLREIGKPDEAMKAHAAGLAIFRKLVDVNPDNVNFERLLAVCHNSIGTLLSATRKPAEAMKAHKSALAIRLKLTAANPTVVRLQSDLAESHHNLGSALVQTGKPEEAIKAQEAALAILQKLVDVNPDVTEFQTNLASSYTGIGDALGAGGKLEEELKFYESGLVIRQRLAREHPASAEFASALGFVLNNMASVDFRLKRFEEARARLRQAVEWQRRALASNPAHPIYRYYLGNHLDLLIKVARGLGDTDGVVEAERKLTEHHDSDPVIVALDARLDAILKGNQQSKDNAERLRLAQRAYDKALHTTATRLWAEALAANPKLGDDRQAQHRYNAACAAALAGSGRGKDDPPPDDAAKAKLRSQALDWLKAELSAWKRVSLIIEPGNKETVAQTLAHWTVDADLAGIRDIQELAKLAEDERKGWKSHWADVEALRKRLEPSADLGRSDR